MSTINESDLEEEDDIDNDEQIDEKNVQVQQSNDLLLTNEYAIKNEVSTGSETAVGSRPVVAAEQSSIGVTSKAESKSDHKQGQESSKPVHTTKLRKKVEFVIEFPVVSRF